MLTLWGNSQRYSRYVSRRDFIKIGAAGSAMGLADMLRLQAQATPPGASPTGSINKSVIMVYLLGGPGPIDTYDMKLDAPAEFRGEFKPIKTNVSGIEISELFPLQAKMMDKFSLIRSLSATAPNNHSDSEVMTGRNEVANARFQHPCIGSVVSKLRGTSEGSVPQYVALRKMSFPTKTPLPQSLYYLNPAALGGAHAPFLPTGEGMSDFDFAPAMNAQRLLDRMDLLSRFDRMRREVDATGGMSALDTFQGQAAEILTSRKLRDALDLSKEDKRTIERYSFDSKASSVNYGFADGYKTGTQLLLARRLIEAGVGFVEVALGYWDTHGPAHVLGFPHLRDRLCPTLDQALTALVEDLHQRGMEKDVVVIVWGEFGRSPKINVAAGRDHWLPTMSALITGGGLKTGQVIGATDARGENVADNPYKISNVLATIYKTIGIDPAINFVNTSGRPTAILDDREPIRELL
jgi:hypothetical protein